MKNKKLLVIFLILFFLVVNTSDFWEKEVGILIIPILLILGVLYVVFLIRFLFEFYYAIKERLKNKPRLYLLTLLLIVLITIPLFPRGIVNFDKLEGEDLLVAYSEGAANCTTTLKIKNNNKFKIVSVCFGVEERKGTYQLKGDTIYFHHKNQENKVFEYGVLHISDTTMVYRNKDVIGKVKLYKTLSDIRGSDLYITKNNLVKQD